MQLIGQNPDTILDTLKTLDEKVKFVLANSREIVKLRKPKREIAEYQAAVLYVLTKPYNKPDANILELGTALGYSASIMAQAAPEANLVTMTPRESEVNAARENLKIFPNVEVLCSKSVDYLDDYSWPELDLIFVDGDHARIKLDLPWWNWLKVGGLFLHHDYSPEDSGRPCPPVYEGINEFSDWLGRKPDVLVVDDHKVGLAGFYKTEDDSRNVYEL